MTHETRDAKAGDVNIACQVVGEGPLDLVAIPIWVSHLGCGSGGAVAGGPLRRARLVLAPDPVRHAGTGLSDRVAERSPPTLEERLDDIGAVMAAAGSERAAEEFLTGHGREPDRVLGDGFPAEYDGPARAIGCADAVRAGARQLGPEVRPGVHTDGAERSQDELRGIAVRIGARVAESAGAGEILVSQTVEGLVVGSGIDFEDRGEHELEDVPGGRRLFAVAP